MDGLAAGRAAHAVLAEPVVDVAPALGTLAEVEDVAAGERADRLPLVQAVAAHGAVVGQRVAQGGDAAERPDAHPPPSSREPAVAVGLHAQPAARAGQERDGGAPDRGADGHPGDAAVVDHGAFAPPLPLPCVLPHLLSLSLALAFCSLALL